MEISLIYRQISMIENQYPVNILKIVELDNCKKKKSRVFPYSALILQKIINNRSLLKIYHLN